jgi:hypothetical protein
MSWISGPCLDENTEEYHYEVTNCAVIRVPGSAESCEECREKPRGRFDKHLKKREPNDNSTV